MSTLARGLAVLTLLGGLTACGSATPEPATVAVVDPPPPPPSDVPIVRVAVDESMAIRGPADAPVTIVVFSDFECPFCARAWPTMDALFERYPGQLRLVFRHNPLPFHAHAALASEAAIEAMAQRGDEGFFAMAALLFENREHLEPADLERYAASLGLDVLRFRAALTGHMHQAAIASDAAVARALGATGTPTFFVNGRVVRGAQPFDVFDAAVTAALDAARARVAAGVPPDAVYDDVLRWATANTIPAPETTAADDRPDVVTALIPPTAPARGPGNAPVVIQIVSDFQCPFCSRVVPTLEELERRYPGRIRFVWRDYPLPFHADAMPAHEAAREAYAQLGDAGFWAMHDLLFANQSDLDQGAALLERLAAQVGLDLPRFRAAMASHVHRAAIQAEITALQALGSWGTPTFFINGRVLVGAQPIDAFVTVVDEALGAP